MPKQPQFNICYIIVTYLNSATWYRIRCPSSIIKSSPISKLCHRIRLLEGHARQDMEGIEETISNQSKLKEEESEGEEMDMVSHIRSRSHTLWSRSHMLWSRSHTLWSRSHTLWSRSHTLRSRSHTPSHHTDVHCTMYILEQSVMTSFLVLLKSW